MSAGGEKVRAFVPSPLPPRPPIEWTPGLRGKFDAALLAVGQLEVHRALQRQPITTAGALVSATGISPATISKCLVHLERLGIVRELTKKRRSRVYSYGKLIKILNEGTEPPNPRRQP